MNGRVAKKIRKRIFGDDATKAAGRRYRIVDGTRYCMGKRQEYQDAKKDYIKEKTP
jgi:hypothetical protein